MTAPAPVPLRVVLGEWLRLGCVGFGGPPAHVALLRELVVARRGWLDEEEFEHGVVATNVLPGPASTQLAIFCAWRVAGVRGALVGGWAFILPGLVLIIALAAALQGDVPAWVRGAGLGAGAVVAAVAVQAGWSLAGPGWARAGAGDASRRRWLGYLTAGAVATILLGPWLVSVLLGCGGIELVLRGGGGGSGGSGSGGSGSGGSGAAAARSIAWPPLVPLAAAVVAGGGLAALAWTAFKVGALSYGGGFVIIPLMRDDALAHGWMTAGEFTSAVALGQATPGPVVQTVAVVGYAAAGLGGAVLAAFVAFAPSFAFIALGAERFERLRTAPRPRAFLDGAGPAAVGAIFGTAVILAASLGEPWQVAVLVAGGGLLLAGRGVVTVILAAALAGALAGAAGWPLPA